MFDKLLFCLKQCELQFLVLEILIYHLYEFERKYYVL